MSTTSTPSTKHSCKKTVFAFFPLNFIKLHILYYLKMLNVSKMCEHYYVDFNDCVHFSSAKL